MLSSVLHIFSYNLLIKIIFFIIFCGTVCNRVRDGGEWQQAGTAPVKGSGNGNMTIKTKCRNVATWGDLARNAWE